ncbi:hypothetical protein DV736_g1102, partial [Chaetothyriales sp. CBS 134916]
MAQSPFLSGPSHNSNKRSRSCESRNEASKPVPSGNGTFIPSTVDGKLNFGGVRLPAYLSKSRAEIQASFDDLELKQRSRLSGALSNSNSPFKLDRSTTVFNRNRYGNVQPWQNSRIKLDFPIRGSDYINASPIKLESRGLRGSTFSQGEDGNVPSEVSRYIATQGPKADQISHFWHMVMQQTPSEGGVIVMLTQPYEGLKEKCAVYFPHDKDVPTITIAPEPKAKMGRTVAPSDDASSGYATSEDDSQHSDPDPDSEPGGYTEAGSVELISLIRDQSIGCQVRQLKLSFGGQSKTIHHYFYASWADFGKPEAEDRIALLQLMRVSRQMADDSARIVHCSAGVGRTGTWIALDFLLRELEEGRLVDTLLTQTSAGSFRQASTSRPSSTTPTWGKSGPQKSTTPEPKVNDVIHDTVDQLRTQRMMMVMNLVQYSFLYEALRELFIEKYAEKESGVVGANDFDDNSMQAPLAENSQERSPKIPRTRSSRIRLPQSIYDGTNVGTVTRDEDTVSEADTIIQDTTAVSTPRGRNGRAY